MVILHTSDDELSIETVPRIVQSHISITQRIDLFINHWRDRRWANPT